MTTSTNPFVNQRLDILQKELRALLCHMTAQGRAKTCSVMASLADLKDHAKPQCPPDENAVHRGCRVND